MNINIKKRSNGTTFERLGSGDWFIAGSGDYLYCKINDTVPYNAFSPTLGLVTVQLETRVRFVRITSIEGVEE